MELHGIERHIGFASAISHEVCKLITNTLITGWFTESHRDCENKIECISCELIVLWHQLASSLVEYISLPNLAHPPDVSKISEILQRHIQHVVYFNNCHKHNQAFFLFND